MESPRNERIFEIARWATTNLYLRMCHRVKVNGLENVPKEGAVLYVDKHTFKRDILIAGKLMDKVNIVMKYSLPHCFEKLGGMLAYRPRDIKKGLKNIKERGRERTERAERLMDHFDDNILYQFMYEDACKEASREKEEFKEDVKITNKRAFDLVKAACSRGEGAVVYVEGHRYEDKVGELNTAIPDYTKSLQDELGIDIPLVVRGFEYKTFKIPFTEKVMPIPFSTVTVNIERVEYGDDKKDRNKRIHSTLERLSGFAA